MQIHTAHLDPTEAERIETAVRRGIGPDVVTHIGSVDIAPSHGEPHTIVVSFSIPAFSAYRTLKVRWNEQALPQVEQRVRELLADL